MKRTVLLYGIVTILFTMVLLTGTCDDAGVNTSPSDSSSVDDKDKDPVDDNKDKDPVDDNKDKDLSKCSFFGTFELIFPEREGSLPSVTGILKDGVTPNPVFKTAETDGDCKLLVPYKPFCDGCIGVCVEEGECVPYPKTIRDAGNVTVKGVKTAGGEKTFTMEAIGGKYSTPTDLDADPFSEGDEVSFSFEGNSNIPAFTIDTKALCRLKVLNDTIWMRDGEDIKLKWEAPKKSGVSKIFVKIDISYHGGTKAKIECETKDDGELTIPAHLLDKLKTYGMAGFPEIEISRKVITTNECGGVELILTDKFATYLQIPGVISCNGDCPEGYRCTDSRLCEKIEE